MAHYRTAFTETNWAETIGDIATFTYHYEQSLIQIEIALHAEHPTEDAPAVEDALNRPLAEVAA